MRSLLGWFAPSFIVLVACASPTPDDFVGQPRERGSSSSTPTLSTDSAQTTECAEGNVAGCSCTPQPPAPCFTGPAALRGQPGCKDGVQQCIRSGEFSLWGTCEGEVTTCGAAVPASSPPAADPPPADAIPNYTQCASLAGSGKRGYGRCNADEVVVIVNDGSAQEMTCCPIGKNVLSSVAAEQHVARRGLCGADEVATGMADPNAGILCTKINAKYLRLSAPQPANYVFGFVFGTMGQVASAYNGGDTCICPEGSIVVGNHTPDDNRCADMCVRLEKR